jgi:hypothetical protein
MYLNLNWLIYFCYSPGKGALARYGEFHYPVRLIQIEKKSKRHHTQWKVVWWRECHFPQSMPPPGTLVSQDDIVDELWKDVKGRRAVQVCGPQLCLDIGISTLY